MNRLNASQRAPLTANRMFYHRVDDGQSDERAPQSYTLQSPVAYVSPVNPTLRTAAAATLRERKSERPLPSYVTPPMVSPLSQSSRFAPPTATANSTQLYASAQPTAERPPRSSQRYNINGDNIPTTNSTKVETPSALRSNAMRDVDAVRYERKSEQNGVCPTPGQTQWMQRRVSNTFSAVVSELSTQTRPGAQQPPPKSVYSGMQSQRFVGTQNAMQTPPSQPYNTAQTQTTIPSRDYQQRTLTTQTALGSTTANLVSGGSRQPLRTCSDQNTISVREMGGMAISAMPTTITSSAIPNRSEAFSNKPIIASNSTIASTTANSGYGVRVIAEDGTVKSRTIDHEPIKTESRAAPPCNIAGSTVRFERKSEMSSAPPADEGQGKSVPSALKASNPPPKQPNPRARPGRSNMKAAGSRRPIGKKPTFDAKETVVVFDPYITPKQVQVVSQAPRGGGAFTPIPSFSGLSSNAIEKATPAGHRVSRSVDPTGNTPRAATTLQNQGKIRPAGSSQPFDRTAERPSGMATVGATYRR